MPFSEDALALEFTARHADDLRYVAGWGRWFRWDDARWQVDDTLRVFDLARVVCREAAVLAKSKKLGDAKVVAAVERLAKSDRRHAATIDQWDGAPWLITTRTKAIEMERKPIVRPHRREDYATKIMAAAYDPDARCPTWDAFLAKVTAEETELQSYLARVAGYCLTGITREHVLVFLYGTGANGKSVFVNTLAGLWGDYHTTAPMETFLASNTDRHPTELAGLRGARLVTATETQEGRRWDEAKIKALTGGDRISARFMRQDFFEFTPAFKLLISGNHKPSLRNVDIAIRRRIHLIPFTVTIPEGERDQELAAKLRAEWPGILRWAVDGCLEWQRIGLAPPETVTKATEEYFQAEDSLQTWIGECCAVGHGNRAPVRRSGRAGKRGLSPTTNARARARGSARTWRPAGSCPLTPGPVASSTACP